MLRAELTLSLSAVSVGKKNSSSRHYQHSCYSGFPSDARRSKVAFGKAVLKTKIGYEFS